MTKNLDGYNGWTNYETWLVSLHIDNEQSSQEFWQKEAESFKDHKSDSEYLSDLEDAVIRLSERLESHFDAYFDMAPSFPPVMIDMLRASLGRVWWREIAENLLEEVEVLTND